MRKFGFSIWIAPALVVVSLLALYPLFWAGYKSLFDAKFGFPEAEFVGLGNYIRLINSQAFWTSLKTTILFIVPSILFQAALGLMIALLLNSGIKGKSFFSGFFIVPMVMMDTMVGLTWRLYYSQQGIYNYFLELIFGKPIIWHSASWALTGIVIAEIWRWTPFFILILLAGLQAVPRELYDAADVDGASSFQKFRYVSFPLLKTLLVIGLILRFVDAMKLFGMIFAMFGGGPGNVTETLPIHIYRTTLLSRNLGLGMAQAIILIVLILITGIFFIRLLKRVKGVQE